MGDSAPAGQEWIKGIYRSSYTWHPAVTTIGHSNNQTVGMTVQIEIPFSVGEYAVVLQAGHVYRLVTEYVRGGVLGTSPAIFGSAFTEINGFFYTVPLDPDIPLNVHPIEQWGAPPPQMSGVTPIGYEGIIYVGADDVVMGWHSYTTVAGITALNSSSAGAVGVCAPIPTHIDLWDITPVEPSDTDKIIAAVEATGDRVIQSIDQNTDRVVNAIDNLGDRIDPKGIPGLKDLNPKEPDTLPAIPTIPGPVAVIGADGVAAMQEIWAAFGNSDFFRVLMVMAGVSIAIGVITYLTRRKKEE